VKMPKPIQVCVSAFAIAFASTNSGCATRVILVPSGEPVRLAESVKARVWVLDSNGNQIKSQNRVTLPEGWYALPKE